MEVVISVVIPFYKTPKLRLRKCIESFLNQSYTDFELLLIDDGNGQEYDEIREEYEKKDPRVKFIKKKNEGVAAARNTGIERATGEYLCFSDSDDFVEENFLWKMHKGIQGNDMVICGVTEQYFPVINSWADKRLFLSQPTFYNGLQYINFSVNKLYKLDIIKKNNIRFDLGVKLGEDALFLEKYFRHCSSIRCIPDLMYHYVPNSESAVHTYEEKYWDWEQQVIERQWEMFHTYPLCYSQEQAMLAWLYVKLKGAFYYYISNEEDKNKLHEKISQIVNHPVYKYLQNCDLSKKNGHLNKKDKIILKLWRMFGSNGVYLSWSIKNVIRG